VAQVEGDIENVSGIVRITTIRIHYRFKIPADSREAAERALEVYAQGCPAYLSVKDSIQVTWDAEIEES